MTRSGVERPLADRALQPVLERTRASESRRRPAQALRLAVAALCASAALAFLLAAGATAATGATADYTAHSWGFVCNSDYGWVRVNWPTIRTDTDELQAVYFRAFLDRYTTSGWRWVSSTRWYVGVSDRFDRHQIDESLGLLPPPFFGVLGHLFAYTTDHGSYAGPQLGPVFLGLPLAYYRVREQYSVGTVKWNSRVTHVWQTNYTSCQA